MPSRIFMSTATLVIAILVGGAAQAQIQSEDEIIVNGQYLSIDKINAVKTPTPIINIPQSLTIIDDSQIKDQAFRNISDITRYAPGLSASQGEGHRDAIIIRGNQTTADFFLDGVRDDVQYYRPLYNLEQVEILRGANALLFGRGGVGGIINRVTKKPDGEDAFTGLTGGVDTFGAYQTAVDVNQPLGDDAALRVNGFYEGLNNHRDFYDGTRFGINPTLAIDVSPDTAMTLSYEYLDDDRTVDRGVPSQIVANGPNVPLEGFENTFFGSPDQNFTTLQAHIFRGHVDHKFTEALRGNFTAQYADYDKAYQNLYASDAVEVTNGPFPAVELDGYRDMTDRENFFLQGNLVGEFETGSIGHTILFGAEYGSQDTANARLDNVFTENGDDQLVIPFTDPLDIPAFGFTNPVRNRQSHVETLSFYAQDQLSLTEQFKIILGGRYDRFDIEALDIAGGNARFSRQDEEFTPRLGAIYKPAENISIYASYSETFLPRSGDQFLTLNLDTESTRPQFTKNLEAGLKWNFLTGLSFTAALFELDRENFTSSDPDDPAQTIIIDGAKTTGLEMQIAGNLTDNWSINTGYSYLNGEVQGGSFDGFQPRQTPKHMFHLWNNYQVTQALGLGLGASYQGSYFARENNTVQIPDYIRFDAAAFYDVTDHIRLQVNVENLLNTNYYPDAHSNTNISTGKPFNARFTVSSRF